MLVFVFWFKFNRLLFAVEFNQISHSWTSELFISWYSERMYIIFDIIDILPDPLYYCTNIRSQNHAFTVYPKKYAHGFCFPVLCCGHTLTDFPISIRLTSLALWQSNDCPSASKATLMNMDKYVMWIHYERLYNHNKAKHNKTVCIFLGIYCSLILKLIYYTYVVVIITALCSDICTHSVNPKICWTWILYTTEHGRMIWLLT